MFMACCFRVKVESFTNNGLNSNDVLNGLSNKASSSSVFLTSRTEGEILQSNNLKCFTFNELKTATTNFHPSSQVDERGFSSVFKGWIDERTLAPTKPGTGFVVAVKMFDKESDQGHSEWLAEFNYLGQLRHPNLVKLIGYCLEDHYRILVYEFFTKGSLDYHLFKNASNFEPLSWKIRMKIALDIANGLAFLHSDEVNVIHGHLKTSKILIDSNYDAKIYDFGLEKDRLEDDNGDDDIELDRMCTGFLVYAAPEYIMTGKLTKKSDVYSFGVVLLEIMLGKRALDKNRPLGEENLVDWARFLLISKCKISHAMDDYIEGEYSLPEAMKVAHIVIQCLSTRPQKRPNIDDVVRSLEPLQNSND